jgi:hypothetical protein
MDLVKNSSFGLLSFSSTSFEPIRPNGESKVVSHGYSAGLLISLVSMLDCPGFSVGFVRFDSREVRACRKLEIRGGRPSISLHSESGSLYNLSFLAY